ncbi:sugar ABC transporter permease (plasmid) [Shinella yambaruensis]|uniref:carbohydrate ABC transporter permease n=1 Tax=Shinella yambaruensis TaxID=415996 RepID=UPI003D7A0B71
MTSTSSSAWMRVQDSPWFWLLPAGLFLLVFYTWPLLDVVRLSFTNASLITPDYDYTFDSYRRVFRDPSTLRTLKVTFLFAGGSVVLKLVLGMGLALAIDAGVKRGLHGIVLVRTSVLAAWVIPGVVVGVLWKILLSTSSHGLLNYWIQTTFGKSVGFLTDPDIALSTAILANVWRGVAFTMILLYAGLQRIPPELYEAARVDGAGAVARFRFVTLPTLAPVIFIALVLITIGGINTFDLIMALTEGGPARSTEVVGLRVYQQVFQFMNLGRGAALAVLLLAVNLLMTLIYLRLLRINRKTD